MSRVSFLGSEMKIGNNLAQAINVQVFLKERFNVNMVFPYWFTREMKTRRLIDCRDSLKKCCICKQDLYTVALADKYDLNIDINLNTLITQKKHAMYMDENGKMHYTCSGVVRCFKNVNHTQFLDRGGERLIKANYKAPSFEEFVDFEVSDLRSVFVSEAMIQDYKEYVIPFIEKWKGSEVAKGHDEFITDLKSLKPFLSFFSGIALYNIEMRIKKLLS